MPEDISHEMAGDNANRDEGHEQQDRQHVPDHSGKVSQHPTETPDYESADGARKRFHGPQLSSLRLITQTWPPTIHGRLSRLKVCELGFVLEDESAMLANKDNGHSVKVFDPSIKGQTDRFAYRFVRP